MMTKRKLMLLSGITAIILIIFLFPLYWVFVSSLKSDSEIFSISQTLWPKYIQWRTYLDQFSGPNNIFTPLKNSIIISFSSMMLSLLLGVPAAYGLVRFKFNMKVKRSFIFIFLLTQMLPVSLVLTPMYLLFNKFDLLNNYISTIIATATISIPFIVLILRPYFLTCPKSVEEAARIEGCSVFSAFYKIVLPISMPGLVTASVFSFIFAWNDLAYSMTFNVKTSMRPLTAGIYNFMTKYGTQWNYIMAYGVILVLPVIIIFIILQKYIVSGMTGGAVKE